MADRMSMAGRRSIDFLEQFEALSFRNNDRISSRARHLVRACSCITSALPRPIGNSVEGRCGVFLCNFVWRCRQS